MRDALLDYGFDVTYEEGEDGHDWDFWSTYIKRILNWLPLEENEAHLSSGSIGKNE